MAQFRGNEGNIIKQCQNSTCLLYFCLDRLPGDEIAKIKQASRWNKKKLLPLKWRPLLMCLFVCLCVIILYFHRQLIACQLGDISHLHTDARSPSVNDCKMKAAVGARRTVVGLRWSKSQLSECCYEINAVTQFLMLHFCGDGVNTAVNNSFSRSTCRRGGWELNAATIHLCGPENLIWDDKGENIWMGVSFSFEMKMNSGA